MSNKKKTTKPEKTEETEATDEAPAVVRRPGDGSRMLSAEEVREIQASEGK